MAVEVCYHGQHDPHGRHVQVSRAAVHADPWEVVRPQVVGDQVIEERLLSSEERQHVEQLAGWVYAADAGISILVGVGISSLVDLRLLVQHVSHLSQHGCGIKGRRAGPSLFPTFESRLELFIVLPPASLGGLSLRPTQVLKRGQPGQLHVRVGQEVARVASLALGRHLLRRSYDVVGVEYPKWRFWSTAMTSAAALRWPTLASMKLCLKKTKSQKKCLIFVYFSRPKLREMWRNGKIFHLNAKSRKAKRNFPH